MRNAARCLLVGAMAWALGACSDGALTAPEGGRAGAPSFGVTPQSAPLPQASCSYSASAAGYDVLLSWSDMAVVRIDVLDSSGSLISRAILAHPTRKGTLSETVNVVPATAEFIPRSGLGAKVRCTAA